MANNNTLPQDEQERLVELGTLIKKLPKVLSELSRIHTAMAEYLSIHDINNFDMDASHEYKTALSDLATYIKGSLDCDINGGLPCKSDRQFGATMMAKLLKISGYEEISTDPLHVTGGE